MQETLLKGGKNIYVCVYVCVYEILKGSFFGGAGN
jgi:hypothetical protein